MLFRKGKYDKLSYVKFKKLYLSKGTTKGVKIESQKREHIYNINVYKTKDLSSLYVYTHTHITYKSIKRRGNSWISGKQTIKSMSQRGLL